MQALESSSDHIRGELETKSARCVVEWSRNSQGSYAEILVLEVMEELYAMECGTPCAFAKTHSLSSQC